MPYNFVAYSPITKPPRPVVSILVCSAH